MRHFRVEGEALDIVIDLVNRTKTEEGPVSVFKIMRTFACLDLVWCPKYL